MNYIDLFAGAGGLSEGFHNAGFHPVAHVEMNSDACDSIRTRLAWYELRKENKREQYNKYLRNIISRDELYAQMPDGLMESVINKPIGEDTRDEIFALIDAQLERLPENNRQVDLIIGGPPCQTFSIAGRARKGRAAMEEDPRSRLYLQYAEFLKRYQPRMFVFENVLGMLSFRQSQQYNLIRAAFEEVGYHMDVREWNARDFGVLQSRDRLIIIGWRTDQTELGYPAFQTQQRDQHTVGELLANLPPLTIEESQKGKQAKKGGAKPVFNYPVGLERGLESDYIINSKLRDECPVLTWHIARPHTASDRAIYRLFIEHWNTHREERPRLRYNELPEHFQSHRNKDEFSDRFKVVAADKTYSQTVVAHIHKDGHYYIHPNLEQARSLSVREAARLQSFPDNFYFEGSRTSVLRQIGNAVPPLMATRIAESVWNALSGHGDFLPPNSPIGKTRSGRVDRLHAPAPAPLFEQA
jgi:DNA (cytosine-5)-methyltransferase 1